MFQPRQDQESAFIANELALQTYRRVPPALVLAHVNESHLMSR